MSSVHTAAFLNVAVACWIDIDIVCRQVFLAVVEESRGLLENDVQAPMKVRSIRKYSSIVIYPFVFFVF